MSQFEEYKKKVIEAYESRKKTDELSMHLMDPTPANLRNECLNVYGESHTEKDIKFLRDFFGPQGNDTNYYQTIWNTNADKFKPLANFLRDTSINTNSKNVELLAYLINFEPRPFRFNYTPPKPAIVNNPNKPSDPKPTNTGPSNDPNNENNHPKTPQQESKTKENKKEWSMVLWTLAIICIIVVISMTARGITNMLKPKYMYWDGKEFQRVHHSKTVVESPIVPIDDHKLINFKKITQPDTLTKKDIYNAWYTKITRDSIEFYTDSAAHPIYDGKPLKPMTEYIWIKWVKNRYH